MEPSTILNVAVLLPFLAGLLILFSYLIREDVGAKNYDELPVRRLGIGFSLLVISAIVILASSFWFDAFDDIFSMLFFVLITGAFWGPMIYSVWVKKTTGRIIFNLSKVEGKLRRDGTGCVILFIPFLLVGIFIEEPTSYSQQIGSLTLGIIYISMFFSVLWFHPYPSLLMEQGIFYGIIFTKWSGLSSYHWLDVKEDIIFCLIKTNRIFPKIINLKIPLSMKDDIDSFFSSKISS